jgi:hypothetical protein
MKDRGEVEAVVQASQVGATVIVDDRWGRELAARADLDHHGTFWVLERFYELKFIPRLSFAGNFKICIGGEFDCPGRKRICCLFGSEKSHWLKRELVTSVWTLSTCSLTE